MTFEIFLSQILRPMSSHFTWEEKYKRTWEKTDSHQQEHIDRIKTPKMNTRKALIRHLHISIDCSSTIDGTDFLPSFRVAINKSMDSFIEKFQKENPLSILTVKRNEGQYFSLKQALEFDMSTYIREILIITCSLSIRDGYIEELIEDLIKQNTKVSIISMCGETKLFQTICRRTGGKLYVPLDVDHLIEIMNKFLIPNVVTSSVVNLLRMGFPIERRTGICICHLERVNGSVCVKCKALICIPCECKICNTMNVDGMFLFKNVYFMKYLKPYEVAKGICGCGGEGVRRCECGEIYCFKCNTFLHEYINFCVKCGN